MRLGVDSIENLRTGIIQTLHASRLPKYRILLNGFGYVLFGVPPGDLESTWRNETLEERGQSPLLNHRLIPTVAASTVNSVLMVVVGSETGFFVLGSGFVVQGYKCEAVFKDATLHGWSDSTYCQ